MSTDKPSVDEQVRVIEELKRRGWRIVKLHDRQECGFIRTAGGSLESLYTIEDEL